MSMKKVKALVRKSLEAKRDNEKSEEAGGGGRPGAICLGGAGKLRLCSLTYALAFACPALCCGDCLPQAACPLAAGWCCEPTAIPALAVCHSLHLDHSSPPA